MKYLYIVLTILSLSGLCGPAAFGQDRIELGNLVLEGIPEIPKRIWDELDPYLNIRSAALQGWLPSGQGLLIKTRFGETHQVHRLDRPGGARRQVTFFREPVTHVRVSPDRRFNGFLFSMDTGGSERYQIFFFDLDTGRHRMYTDGRSKNDDAVWSSGGDRFVYSSTRRNGRDWDLYLADIGDPSSSRLLLETEGAWWAVDWSPDDRTILVKNYISVNETRPYLLDVETARLSPFQPYGPPAENAEPVAYNSIKFSRDGRGVYFVSDENSEFRRLRYHDLTSGRTTVLTGKVPWDVGELALSEDGHTLAFTVNEDGIDRLHVRDLRDGQDLDLPGFPAGRIYQLSFHPDGRRLGLVVNTPRSPGDVYHLDLSGGEPVRWTRSETGGLPGDHFVIPELIRYTTFDSVDGRPRTIPAFYYRPAGEGPFPVVIDIHGGPESQARPYFHARRQFWVNQLGLAVLRPNVRGSRGYGKSYLLLDNGFRRKDSVRDIGRLMDWIAGQPELDDDRVAVYGGSYGGYMALAAMIDYPDRLRAGLDLYGISNFVTFLENTGDYRRDLRRAEYGDERDTEMRFFLEEIAPVNNADRITKPMFIFQGLNDPRVPVTESEQMVETIREAGGEVWYLLATDEGHGTGKKANREFLYAATALFLETHLLGAAP
jgi:dipeptidyl aminopeptidase/acylaminoacyl peptidase